MRERRVELSRIRWRWLGHEGLSRILRVFGLRVYRRMLAERDDHHLNQSQQVAGGRQPVVQVRQINLSVVVDVHRHLDVHVGSWLDVANRRVVRVRVHYPNADWDVISVF